MAETSKRKKKVCIIGFDSLDYYLIEKYDLNFIKQKEFGKMDVDEYASKMWLTPTMWTSFITGLKPEKHGVVGWKWENPILNGIKGLGVKIGFGKIIGKSRFLNSRVSKITENKRVPNIKGKISTIFDYAQYPIDIDVPCYSEDTYQEQRHDVTYAIGDPIAEKKVAEKAWKLFQEKKTRVLNKLNDEWDLFMVHFYMPDVIQHLLWYRDTEIEKLYKEIDDTARLIQSNVEKSTLLLFTSDHGQKKGLHTPNAFYSSNQPLNLNEPKITDFAGIIRERLGGPSQKEFDTVRNRLKELGYI